MFTADRCAALTPRRDRLLTSGQLDHHSVALTGEVCSWHMGVTLQHLVHVVEFDLKCRVTECDLVAESCRAHDFTFRDQLYTLVKHMCDVLFPQHHVDGGHGVAAVHIAVYPPLLVLLKRRLTVIHEADGVRAVRILCCHLDGPYRHCGETDGNVTINKL